MKLFLSFNKHYTPLLSLINAKQFIIPISIMLLSVNACSTISNKTAKQSINTTITQVESETIIITKPSVPQKEVKPVQIIGGLSAPIYFQNYDQKMIDEIANIKTAKKIMISYPTSLKLLAIQIHDGISIQTQIPIQLYEVNLQDTATVKYRHNVVIVALDFRQ